MSASLKLNRVKLIAKYKEAIAKRVVIQKEYESECKKYEDAVKVYEAKVLEYATSGKAKVESVHMRSWANEVTFTVTIPNALSKAAPERNVKTIPYNLEAELTLLRSNVAALELCDDDQVPQSLHKNALQYIA